jgi:hypothetical protein
MICINQETGEKDEEPFVTLAKTRRFDSKIFFGSHICHTNENGDKRESVSYHHNRGQCNDRLRGLNNIPLNLLMFFLFHCGLSTVQCNQFISWLFTHCNYFSNFAAPREFGRSLHKLSSAAMEILVIEVPLI